MASTTIRDYRGLAALTAEQQAWLDAARASAAHRGSPAGGAAAAAAPLSTVLLSSGHRMPLVGLGTWKASPGQVRAAVLAAVRCGYRHIDCAAIYANEHEVGAALAQLFAEGAVAREELFITTKLWNSDHGCVEAACRRSLAALRLEYVDLFLIHWPPGCAGPVGGPAAAAAPITTPALWEAMEALVDRGLACSIGMSNFSARKLAALLDGGGALRIRPAVLQVEAHPYFCNTVLLEWAAAQGIHVTAYSPLGSPDSASIMMRGADTRALLDEPEVLSIAARHGRTPAQVLIRWALQRGCSVLPKSTHPDRIAANLAVLDWRLDPSDVQRLASLPYQVRMVDGHMFLSADGPFRTLLELWDDPVGI